MPTLPDPRSVKAALVEIFDSIQGEGRFVGAPMAFVRFATCPLRCVYCDTPNSYVAQPTFAVASRGGVRHEPNPATSERVAALVREVVGDMHAPHPVSVTGGEPLVYPHFIRALADGLGPRFPLHLETAALDAVALTLVLPSLRHLSADYKLPETVQGHDHGAAHVACVAAAVAHGGVSIDVKIVLTVDIADASLARALSDLAPFADAILLVLQPVTPFGPITATPSPVRLHGWLSMARAAGFNVRVLPQVHKLLRVP